MRGVKNGLQILNSVQYVIWEFLKQCSLDGGRHLFWSILVVVIDAIYQF